MRRGLTMLAVLAVMAAGPVLADPGAEVVRRVQVVYDPLAGEVARIAVGVVDPHPRLRLEFLWEPAPGNWPGVDADGLATGPGTLTWRIPGTASYDPRAMHDRFEGTLAAGMPEGAGTLTARDGSRREGTWRAGRLEGAGRFLDADGNLYEGAFRAGLPHGQGTLRSREGWIYTGGFRDGLRDGEGHIRLAGGQEYDVTMRAGVEEHSTRPLEIVDSTLGGLLPAQGGGDAGKTVVSVVTDQRTALNDPITYTHLFNNGTVVVYPNSWERAFEHVWNGSGPLSAADAFAELSHADFLASRAYLRIDLATIDRSTVTLKDLRLVVDRSLPQQQPVLEAVQHWGCTGYRPGFHFLNRGWGAVENPTLRVRFLNPDSYDWNRPAEEQGGGTDWIEVPVSGFFEGADVDLSGVLVQLGVDTTALAGNRFTCPSSDDSARCNANLRASVAFGALAGYVGSGLNVETLAVGEIGYDWRDATGTVRHSTQSFTDAVQLARIETPPMMAEMGAGGAFFAEAPEFRDIELAAMSTGAVVDLPVRGNPEVSRLTSRIKLWSGQSALHSLHVEAEFADGSIRSSLPIQLFYLSLRDPQFETALRPAACYLAD